MRAYDWTMPEREPLAVELDVEVAAMMGEQAPAGQAVPSMRAFDALLGERIEVVVETLTTTVSSRPPAQLSSMRS